MRILVSRYTEYTHAIPARLTFRYTALRLSFSLVNVHQSNRLRSHKLVDVLKTLRAGAGFVDYRTRINDSVKSIAIVELRLVSRCRKDALDYSN